MAKYIDAVHLKVEIEKRLKNIRDYMSGRGMRYKAPLPEDTVIFQKGIEEGKRLMMEDAVEGEYGYFSNASKTILPSGKLNIKEGQKVSIIVLPKED